MHQNLHRALNALLHDALSAGWSSPPRGRGSARVVGPVSNREDLLSSRMAWCAEVCDDPLENRTDINGATWPCANPFPTRDLHSRGWCFPATRSILLEGWEKMGAG